MNELLAAAKAVISAWDDQYRSIDMRLKNLRAAVERADKQEAVGFSEWWDASSDIEMAEVAIHKWDECWTAAQQAERERIREIIKAIGVQGEHDQWFDCVDTILEKIDATTG